MPIEEGRPAHERRRRPETLRLRAVMPMLRVSDLDRSVTWYRDIMGFVVAEELREDDRLVAVQLKAGKVRFLLEQDDALPAGVRDHGIQLFCATRQDVTRLLAAVQERGGQVRSAPDEAEGRNDFSVVDPDGYMISIFWRPDA